MNVIYSLVLFPLMGLFFDLDCDGTFTCKPIQSNSSNDYTLALVLNGGVADNYNLELYDLTTGDLVKKSSIYFSPGLEKVVFRQVLPSTYLVYYSTATCSQKKSISGKGIILQ